MAYTLNGLTIEVYSTGTTRIADPGGLIPLATGLQFASGFPGGLYLECSFYVPRKLAQYWDVRGAQRVVIRNGQKVVYEGKIDNLNSQSAGAEQGTLVECTGYWGALAMRYKIRKNWVDKRITEDVWRWDTTLSATNKATADRQGRIRFIPKAEAWTQNQYVATNYSEPIGQTAKRITYTYTLAEGGQDWEIRAQRSTDGLSWTTLATANGDTFVSGTTSAITASGTGNLDITLGTPSRYLSLQFIARANPNQTPTADGTYYGEFSAITVYSETGTIDAEEVAYDVIGACSELSTSLAGVYDGLAAETLPALDFLVFDEFTSLADILASVAGYGNTSDESIYFQMRSSEDAETNDGKPQLAGGVYPDLTSAHYTARLTDANVVNADISRDYSTIQNWIAVNYTDELGNRQVITPDDSGYATLTDATSTAAYGRRVESIQSGTFTSQAYYAQLPGIIGPGGRPQSARPSTAALALYYGKRYLKKWAFPIWRGSVTVQGYIYGSSGNQIPASEIEAGKVLDLADYVVDEVLASDTLDYPRVIITATSYDAETEQCVISFGPLDDLQMIKVETVAFPPRDEPIVSGGGDGGGKKGNLNWKRKLGLEEGSDLWNEAVKLGKAGFKAKYPNFKKKKG